MHHRPLVHREECPNERLSDCLSHVRRLIDAWRSGYNQDRVHTGLDGLSPWAIAYPSGGDKKEQT